MTAPKGRQHIYTSNTRGERAADWLTALVGSWRFIIVQNVIVVFWILVNVIGVFLLHWDPYPFILLNLLFSWQASNTGPVLQMTGNRSAAKDRQRDDLEAEEVAEDHQILLLLHTINAEQLDLLRKLSRTKGASRVQPTAHTDPPTGD